MTNEELIAKIKAEIERLYDGEAPKHDQQCDFSDGYFTALSRIDEFLDTLESEKPIEGLENEAVNYCFDNGLNLSPRVATDFARHFAKWGAEHTKIDVTDFCKPIDPGIAQCIADHSWEMLGEDEKPVQNDLEEAADEMSLRAFPEKKSYSTVIDRVVDYNAVDRKNYRDGIIAGAKWQKEQDLAEMAQSKSPLSVAYANRCFENGKQAMKEQMLKDAVKWLVDDDYDELTDKGRFILGSVGIGYNGYYIPYSDLLKLPKEDDQ